MTIPAPLAAAVSDRYRLDRELGQGGMATVYLAHDLKHDRDVALKVLRPELAAVLGRERFLTEIRLTARLDHPHILTLIDSGESDGFLWYVVPFVRGESLRQRLEREKQLGIEEALGIIRQIAGALDYAHQKGVIHRDLKPENILLHEGEAMLADFGIALAVKDAGGNRLTETGLSLGTPQYMSPEQATGDRQLDARSDVYSLAAVLYELLTGDPPHTGSTVQAVIAKLMTTPPLSLRVIRPGVPEGVERAVNRALSKVPADRFASAGEFVAGLPGDKASVPPESLRPWRTRWRDRVSRFIVAVALAALTVSGWLRFHNRGAAGLDPDVIAVAPFDVLMPQLNLWHEGMVDLLARNLDGAGPLRTVAPTVIMRRWGGRADLPSAQALGQATGARLVVYGSLVPLGGDSVQLRGSLLDVGEARLLNEFQISGTAERVVQLSDSATVLLFQTLGRIRSIGSSRYGSLGSRSPPALKEFLAAEQYYRRSEWDSAAVHYERATALDSTFALAWNRLGTVVGWQSSTTDSLESVFFLRAGRLNHGLAPRDSLLLTADSAMAALTQEPGGTQAWSWRKRILGTSEEAAQRYPDDPAAWYSLGEARIHYGIGPGLSPGPRATLDAFERAIRLDSSFAPSYIHCIELATELGGAPAAEPFFQAYFRLNPKDRTADGRRLSQALLDPLRRGTPKVYRVLDTMSADGLWTAYQVLAFATDTATPVLPVAVAIGTGRPGSHPMWRNKEFRQWLWTAPLVLRGRYHEAVTAVGKEAGWVIGLAALAGAVPADSGAAAFHHMLAAREVWTIGFSEAPAFWAGTGDTASLRTLVRVADSISRTPGELRYSSYWASFSQVVRADLALARGDTADAVGRFAAISDTLCPTCAWEHLHKARVLAAAGRDREALNVLDAGVEHTGWYNIWFALERARLVDRLGQFDRAVQEYQTVTDYWAKADRELQPLVEESRRALRRLSAEGRRRP